MILSVCRAGDEKRWEGANFNITNERQSMVNSGAGTAYPSGAHEFTRGFIGVGVTRSLVLYVCFVDRCLAIVLSVLLRYTDSDYPFGIFKLF